jgi:hypothetical protein
MIKLHVTTGGCDLNSDVISEIFAREGIWKNYRGHGDIP